MQHLNYFLLFLCIMTAILWLIRRWNIKRQYHQQVTERTRKLQVELHNVLQRRAEVQQDLEQHLSPPPIESRRDI
jgi:hypothetical protein